MKLILDTNVVLDWLVFEDPSLSTLREGVRAGQVVVATHAPAVEELRRVLTYPTLKLAAARQREVFERYQAHTALLAEPPADRVELPERFPRCRDPDDDPFFALAWRAQADALVSKDKKVLKLARRCRKLGFQVLTVRQMNDALDRLSH